MKPAASTKYGFSQTLEPVIPDKYPTRLPFHLRISSWALAILCSSAFYLGPTLLVLPMILMKYHRPWALLLTLVDVILAFHPVNEWYQFRTFFQLWYGLFNLHTNVDPKGSGRFALKDEISIVAMHPHAIIPLHGFLWSAFCEQFFPHFYGVGASTDIAMRLPILRHVLGFISVGSAQKGVILKSMQVEGENLFILPGGVAEIFLSRRHSDIQTIKAKRYGLMKLSLETGAAIIPAYTFGATDLFDQLTPVNKDKHTMDKLKSKRLDVFELISETIESLSRRFQGGMTVFWGKGFLPIPHTPQISMVFGDPIYPVPGTERSEMNLNGNKRTCKKIPNPTHEQVHELMDRYTEALYSLFEQYKGEAGYPNNTLRIV